MKIQINGYNINITVEGCNGRASREELCYFLNTLWCAIEGAKYFADMGRYLTAEHVQHDLMREIDRIDPHFYDEHKK